MGWTQDQTFEADLNYVACAFAGRAEMLEAIFGSSQDQKATINTRVPRDARGRPLTMTPDVFDRMFGDGTEQDGRPRKIRYKRGGRTIQ